MGNYVRRSRSGRGGAARCTLTQVNCKLPVVTKEFIQGRFYLIKDVERLQDPSIAIPLARLNDLFGVAYQT